MGGIFQEIYTPNFEQTKFFVEKGVVQEKTNDGGTKWITESNEKKVDFLLNEQIFLMILK